MGPERSWLSVEWDKPKRPSAVHGFLDQIAGRLIGDKSLRRSGEREWRKAAEYRNASKDGSRSRAHPSAPNGRSADGNIFSGLSGLFGGRKLISASTKPTPSARRGTTTRDRPLRSSTAPHPYASHQDKHRGRPVASRRRATDSSARNYRQERR